MLAPRNSSLSDEAIAGLLGLRDLRIGRHSPVGEDVAGAREFWIQSIWRSQILPAFDVDAFIAVVTCAEPWQQQADPRPSRWARFKRLLGAGAEPPSSVVTWRKAVLSLQGEPTMADLPHDPVAVALRSVDLFETYEYNALDGIGYDFHIQTWSIRARLSFGNPEVPSLQGLAKALFQVGQEVARSSGCRPVAEYLKVWSQYDR